MCKFGQIWKKYGIIIFQEILAILNIIAGIVIFYLGFIILRLAPDNPIVSQGSGIFIALGITLIFFGLGLVYTYYKDYKSEQDTVDIKDRLGRIENKIEQLIPISESTPPIKTGNELIGRQKHDETTRKKRIDQVTLELHIESTYLTGIGIASAVEVSFIGILGITDIRTILLSIIFVGLLIYLRCEYRSKMTEIKEIFED